LITFGSHIFAVKTVADGLDHIKLYVASQAYAVRYTISWHYKNPALSKEKQETQAAQQETNENISWSYICNSIIKRSNTCKSLTKSNQYPGH
jgi:predicted phosphoadenosine phosphosulfate sulfurtransferase